MTAYLLRILALVAEGLTDEEIAGRIGIAQPTVRTSLKRVCEAYGATGRAHAVALAIRAGDLR